ncbi:hypothetical protein Mapa_005096 [Marchantia paleacea]|nr:hypothetical protein Mapa_005096 [Marchantia paleacea]
MQLANADAFPYIIILVCLSKEWNKREQAKLHFYKMRRTHYMQFCTSALSWERKSCT